LHLVQANGSAFDPTTYAAFRDWLLKATSTNMAYMLSAQLVTTELDVLNGLIKAGAWIDLNALGNISISTLQTGVVVGSTTYNLNVDNAGFATVQSILDAANAILGTTAGDNATASSALRSYEEMLKNILDAMNNNKVLAVAVLT